MKNLKLGNTDILISQLGLGCMGMSEFYGASDDQQSLETLEKALELGINFYDTANVYGQGHNEELLAKFIADKRENVVLATKCGIVRKKEDPLFRGVDGSYDYIKSACERSLKRLNTEIIDLYYLHRMDEKVQIEESMEAMKDLVKEGKIRAVGLSEANPETIIKANKVVPISALQTELSLWSRYPEKAIIPLCNELGITFVPYSPLGRGFLSGTITDIKNLDANDYRKNQPRFEGENFQKNLDIVEKIKIIADRKKCTLAQLSLAWMLNKFKNIAPIPGTRREKYLRENIQSTEITLSVHEIIEIETLVESNKFQGERYQAQAMKAFKMDEY